ncbi:MAG: nicotinamide-nucleotide amidohydrolase family protein, partial [Deltaproteobacteria bacterium]
MEIEKAIGDLLRKNRMTLSAAESCTGGLVCDRITNVSGSSAYFEGGIVSYTIKAKAKHLGIPAKYIERYGVVSPQVAKRMAEGVRRAFRTTFGLSTTGVAGPAGGTRKTPVGTVFIALSDENGTRVEKLFLKGTRRKIKEAAAEKCLQLLYDRFVPVPGTQGAGSQRAATGDISNRIEELRQSKKSKIVLIRKTSQGILDGKERLGIFPASFNPPTLAHLALVKEAGGQGKLDEILLLLDIRAMDKKPVEAEFGDRLRMLKKVFGRDPKISIGLSNHGLFLDKIEPLRDVYPDPIE